MQGLFFWDAFFVTNALQLACLHPSFFVFHKKRKNIDAIVCFRTGEDETQKKLLLLLQLLSQCSCTAYLLAQ